MLRLTARELVRQHAEHGNVTQRKIEAALDQRREEGWRANYLPRSLDPDRQVVLVRRNERIVPLFEATFEASRSAFHAATTLDAAAVAECIGEPVVNRTVTRCLGSFGLAVVDASPRHLYLAGTSPRLASLVNGLRHRRDARGRGRDDRLLVEVALDLTERPTRLHDETRLRAADTFESLNVDAGCVLDAGSASRPSSPWHIEDIFAHPEKGVLNGH